MTLKSDSDKINTIITQILNNPTSNKSLKLVEDFFNPKQSIENIRMWFNKVPGFQLSHNILDNIKKIIIKPKSVEVYIIRDIMQHQQSLSNDDIEQWLSYIKKESDRRTLAMSVILNHRFTNIDIKLQLVEEMLHHVNYISDVFEKLGALLANDSSGLWTKVFTLIIELIKLDNNLSDLLATKWVDSNYGAFLDLYASHRDIECKLLYEKTRKLQYISNETKDIFIF